MGIYSGAVWGCSCPRAGEGMDGFGSACAPQGQNIWKSELLNIKVFASQVQTAISVSV